MGRALQFGRLSWRAKRSSLPAVSQTGSCVFLLEARTSDGSKFLKRFIGLAVFHICAAALLAPAGALAAGDYQVFVSNERSGDLTVINGADFEVIATIPVGKRPRGIHASPDGRMLYVALSGTPISGPPPLDARGNPILAKNQDDNNRPRGG